MADDAETTEENVDAAAPDLSAQIKLVEQTLALQSDGKWPKATEEQEKGTPEQIRLKAFVIALQNHATFGAPLTTEDLGKLGIKADFLDQVSTKTGGIWNEAFEKHLEARIASMPDELTEQQKGQIKFDTVTRWDSWDAFWMSAEERKEQTQANMEKAHKGVLDALYDPFKSKYHAQTFVDSMKVLRQKGVELLIPEDRAKIEQKEAEAAKIAEYDAPLITKNIVKDEIARLEKAQNPAAIKLMDSLILAYAAPFSVNSLLGKDDKLEMLEKISSELSTEDRFKKFYKEARAQFKENPSGYKDFEAFLLPMIDSLHTLPFGVDKHRDAFRQGILKAVQTAGDDENKFSESLLGSLNDMVEKHGLPAHSNYTTIKKPVLHPKLLHDFEPIVAGGKSFSVDDIMEAYNNYHIAHSPHDSEARKHAKPAAIYDHSYMSFKDDSGKTYIAAIDKAAMVFTIEEINEAELGQQLEDYLNPFNALGIKLQDWKRLSPEKLAEKMEGKELSERQKETITKFNELYVDKEHLTPSQKVSKYLNEYAYPKLREASPAYALMFPPDPLPRPDPTLTPRAFQARFCSEYADRWAGGAPEIKSLADVVAENKDKADALKEHVKNRKDPDAPHVAQGTSADAQAAQLKEEYDRSAGPAPDSADRTELLSLARELRAKSAVLIDSKLSMLGRYDGRTDLILGTDATKHAEHIRGTSIAENPDEKPMMAYYDASKDKYGKYVGIIRAVPVPDELMEAYKGGDLAFSAAVQKMGGVEALKDLLKPDAGASFDKASAQPEPKKGLSGEFEQGGQTAKKPTTTPSSDDLTATSTANENNLNS